MFLLRVAAIEYFPPFIGILHQMLMNVFETGQLACSIELPIEVRPLVVRDPIGGIGRNGDFSSGSREQVPPFPIVNLIVSLPNFDGQHEGEQQFVLLE